MLIRPENPLDLKDGSTVETPSTSDDSTKITNTSWVKSLIGLSIQAASDLLTSLSNLSSDGFLKKVGNTISVATSISISDIQNFVENVLITVGSVFKEPTGFPNQTDSEMTFDNLSRTFSISPTGTEFTFYVNGNKYTKNSTQSLQILDTEGAHFIYFNSSGVLSGLLTFDPDLITNGALCQYIYWDATNKIAIYKGEERHGIVMDSATHLHLHRTFGARYVSGFALENFVIGDGSLNSHAQFTAAAGQLNDEDLQNIMNGTSTIPVFYMLGNPAVLRRKTADSFPFIYSGSAGYTGANGRIAYNPESAGNYSLTEVSENYITMLHLYGTNDSDQPTICVLSPFQYATLELAKAEVTQQSTHLALPFPEFVPIGVVFVQSSTAFTNAVKARVVEYATNQPYADLRRCNAYNVIGASGNHSFLSGLDLDSHPHYLLRSLLTTKGDLFVRGTSIIERLGVGTNNQVLTSDSTSSTGLKYAVPLPEVLTPIHATTTLTIAVATDTLMTGMTITPGAGTYKVEFIGANITNNNNADRTITFTFYVNGVAQTASAKTIGMTNANTENSIVILKDKFTVANGQTIDVRWRGSTAGITYSITQRTLILERCQ